MTVFKTLAANGAGDDWSPNACFDGPHRSAADLLRSTSVLEIRNDPDRSNDQREAPNCTFCSFCETPDQHWQHFRHKHRQVINTVEISEKAQRMANARSAYNRWSRCNASEQNRIKQEQIQAPVPSSPKLKEDKGCYKVKVYTGHLGTKMKAKLKLTGTKGSSSFFELRRGPKDKQFVFFSETIETFFPGFGDLGDITSCSLQIEGSSGQEWFINEIVVVDLKGKKAWSFNINATLQITSGHRAVTFEIGPRKRTITHRKLFGYICFIAFEIKQARMIETVMGL